MVWLSLQFIPWKYIFTYTAAIDPYNFCDYTKFKFKLENVLYCLRGDTTSLC